MCSEIKIVLPSSGRSKTFTTDIKNQILCVCETELEEYKERANCDVISHPPLKNLASKRNWIIEKFGDVFMVDDDVLNFVSVFDTLPRDERNLSSQKQYDIIQNLYEISKDLKVNLFGFSSSPVPMQFNSLKPLGFNINMCGGAYGVINSKLRFNEKTTACDSHWIQLLNLYLYKKNLVDRRYSIEFQETFYTSGGQSKKRTLESEKRDTLFLRKTFGEIVQLRKKSRNKQNNKYQRFINYGKI
jgi:hypothetical protein